MADEDPVAEADEFAVDPAEALRRSEAGEAKLIDVRTAHEWDAGHIPGAVHVELNDLVPRAEELEGPLVFYCRAGRRSDMAAAAFREAGRDAIRMEGGIEAWRADGLPLEPAEGYVAESGDAAAVLEERRREAGVDPREPW